MDRYTQHERTPQERILQDEVDSLREQQEREEHRLEREREQQKRERREEREYELRQADDWATQIAYWMVQAGASAEKLANGR